MKCMLTWKIAPGDVKSAAEAFLKSGAPAPKGLTFASRRRAPGSATGWAVIEDAEAGKVLAGVYGK
jgi:hypothetical protein